jgi:hypothetical protein
MESWKSLLNDISLVSLPLGVSDDHHLQNMRPASLSFSVALCVRNRDLALVLHRYSQKKKAHGCLSHETSAPLAGIADARDSVPE